MEDFSQHMTASIGYLEIKNLPPGSYYVVALDLDRVLTDIYVVQAEKQIVTGRIKRLTYRNQYVHQTTSKPLQVRARKVCSCASLNKTVVAS